VTTNDEFDAALPAAARDLIVATRRFAAAHVAPLANRWERERHWPLEMLGRASTELRLSGIEVAGRHGGLALPFGARVRVAEELARADFGFAFAIVNHHNAAARISESGTPDAVERFLPALLTGQTIGCTAMSEPSAGSDFAAIATSAQRVGGGWRLSGTKRWIGNAVGAGLALTFAQTDPATRSKGIACFLVDAAQPGFERLPPEPLPGLHAAGIGAFALHDCFVPDAHVLYPPGEGFRLAMAGVNKARAHIAAMMTGVMDAALGRALAYGRTRHAFERTLLEHQGLRWSLADVATDIEALRLLTGRTARLIERGEDAQLAAAMAKKFAGERGSLAIAACIQAQGAHGLLEDGGLHRHAAAARAMCLADGTTEMMNERIGALLARPV